MAGKFEEDDGGGVLFHILDEHDRQVGRTPDALDPREFSAESMPEELGGHLERGGCRRAPALIL